MPDGIVPLILVALLLLALLIASLVKTRKKPKPLTVLVCGACGVGKSTLINTIIGFPASQTGIGAPVTQNTVRIEIPSGQLAFYDSKGLEVQEANQTYLLLMSDLLKLRFHPIVYRQMDILLMCIQEPQARIDDAHYEIARLCDDLQIPFGIVITKTEGNHEFEMIVRRQFPSALFVRRIRSLPLTIRNVVIPAEGLDVLMVDLRGAVSRNAGDGNLRAMKGRGIQQLSALARELAMKNQDDLAWTNFGANAWLFLEMRGSDWATLLNMLRSNIRKSLVPNFFKRLFNTSFDNQKIDGAIARRILPLVICRFGDNSRMLTNDDMMQASSEALQILKQDRPYRSRF